MSDVMIEARGLGKRYGNFVALQNASFELHRGEILGFLGPNGAGKSTTMKILTCFIAPSSGTATVNGFDLWSDPLGVRRSIGYLPESTPLYTDMVVFDYLRWAASMRDLRGLTATQRIVRVIDEAGLEDVVSKPIGQLSKGYKQRVGLAQALIHEPPILILDEPMSGLDPNQADEIRELIKTIGKERTIILSTHNLSEVQVTCQRVLIVNKGRIVADDTPEALSQTAGRARYQVSILKGRKLEGGAIRDTNGSSPDARAAFEKIKGADTVRELPTKGDELRIEILAGTDDDLRAEIFRAAVQNGLILIGLTAKAQNLEDVFRDLTIGAAPEADDDEEDEDEDEDEASDEEEEQDDEESEDSASSDEDEGSDDDEDDEASDDDDEDDDSASDEGAGKKKA